jgi:hypothetical protein
VNEECYVKCIYEKAKKKSHCSIIRCPSYVTLKAAATDVSNTQKTLFWVLLAYAAVVLGVRCSLPEVVRCFVECWLNFFLWVMILPGSFKSQFLY